MAYCSQADIEAQVGSNNIIAFLADGGEQTMDELSDKLSDIIEVADASINGRISSIYTVPINPTPDRLRYASIIFTCEILYRRRLSPTEKNPFTEEADRLREELTKIGAGELNLSLTVAREFEQGALTGQSTLFGTMGSNNLWNSR